MPRKGAASMKAVTLDVPFSPKTEVVQGGFPFTRVKISPYFFELFTGQPPASSYMGGFWCRIHISVSAL